MQNQRVGCLCWHQTTGDCIVNIIDIFQQGASPIIFITFVGKIRENKTNLDPSLPENYRSVYQLCLLTGLHRVFDFQKFQSSFCKLCSTETAVPNDILMAADASVLVLLDLKVAYCRPTILIYRLNHLVQHFWDFIGVVLLLSHRQDFVSFSECTLLPWNVVSFSHYFKVKWWQW